MNWLLYWLGRALVALVQAFPLSWVTRFGRACGAAAYAFDARHRSVALRNLTMCFGGEKEPEEIEALARENFRRIGENFACAIRIAAMGDTEFKTVMTVIGIEKLTVGNSDIKHRTVVAAIGHFGNFELYAHTCRFMPHYRFATTYRGLHQPAFNRLMQELRIESGCLFFERRVDMVSLKATMHQSGLILGLLADQHAGDRGARLPFFG
ncbi:MAG: hypothetical protein HY300_02400, partial [Verrucomicrobia bacterium]|nr:hypothetical protein [Verrucomicrobiota bacterium]